MLGSRASNSRGHHPNLAWRKKQKLPRNASRSFPRRVLACKEKREQGSGKLCVVASCAVHAGRFSEQQQQQVSAGRTPATDATVWQVPLVLMRYVQVGCNFERRCRAERRTGKEVRPSTFHRIFKTRRLESRQEES
jgi:hypothetical protein